MSDGDLLGDEIATMPASVHETQRTDAEIVRQSNLSSATPTHQAQPQQPQSQSQSQTRSLTSPAGASNHPLDFDVETDRIKLSLSDATDLLTGVATVVALIQ